MTITSDPVRTEERYVELRRYMDAEVTDGTEFVCSSSGACRGSLKPGLAFAAGQLSYLGPHYDVMIDGQPLRVLVVAMDTGRLDELVTLDQRREQVLARCRERFSERNPHMRGTTSALRFLFGRTPGDDRSGELLELTSGERVHMLEAYAMANLRLCTAAAPGSTESKGTTVMSRNCLRHLDATIRVLEPNVIVLQGKQLRTQIRLLVQHPRQVTDELEVVITGGREVVLASFSHPSYPATKMHWGRLTTVPYLWDTVVPTLQRARSTAVSVDEPADHVEVASTPDAASPPPDLTQPIPSEADADDDAGHGDGVSASDRQAGSVARVLALGRASTQTVGKATARTFRAAHTRWRAYRSRPRPGLTRERPVAQETIRPYERSRIVEQVVETCPSCSRPISQDGGRCGCS